MKLAPRFANVALAQFEDGHEYPLEVREHRSSKSHAFFFASVNSAWQNLDEEALKRYPTSDHLRKWALIKAGFYDETNIVFETSQDAVRGASMARKLDQFAVVTVKENVVRIFTAQSQSLINADKERFKEQSAAVLEILSGKIGVSQKALEREGRLE